MIYDRAKAGRMLSIALEITSGAIDLATRPGGQPGIRPPALETEKTLRTLAAKGDVDAMMQEYLRVLGAVPDMGRTLHRYHQKSFESELYRFVTVYWEKE
jgi:hypothetical protein